MEVIELVAGESLEQEALWEGKILVGERREKMMVLGPLDKAVCVQKQVILMMCHSNNVIDALSKINTVYIGLKNRRYSTDIKTSLLSHTSAESAEI